MNVVPMQVFVSLLLVAGSLVLFLFTVRQRDFDHGERLSLAPLEDDGAHPKPSHPRSDTRPAAPGPQPRSHQ